MTTITAKLISDGINLQGNRLRSVLCRYPKWIHAEGRTHRQLTLEEDDPRTPSPMQDRNLSRNASSSRAVPVQKLVNDVIADPAIPLVWGKKQPGMQGGEDWNQKVTLIEPRVTKGEPGTGWTVEDYVIEVDREAAWLRARDHAVKMALAFDAAGYHKQLVNRLLEPFMHINVLYTGTEWENFFKLRIHADAEPHIYLLAQEIKKSFEGNEPKITKPGEWQLPFVEDVSEQGELEGITLSVARCAHLSYTTVAGESIDLRRACIIYDKLLAADPVHASPAEHQATPDEVYHSGALGFDCWENPEQHGNLVGWRQFRKTLIGESVPALPGGRQLWKRVGVASS